MSRSFVRPSLKRFLLAYLSSGTLYNHRRADRIIKAQLLAGVHPEIELVQVARQMGRAAFLKDFTPLPDGAPVLFLVSFSYGIDMTES